MMHNCVVHDVGIAEGGDVSMGWKNQRGIRVERLSLRAAGGGTGTHSLTRGWQLGTILERALLRQGLHFLQSHGASSLQHPPPCQAHFHSLKSSRQRRGVKEGRTGRNTCSYELRDFESRDNFANLLVMIRQGGRGSRHESAVPCPHAQPAAPSGRLSVPLNPKP